MEFLGLQLPSALIQDLCIPVVFTYLLLCLFLVGWNSRSHDKTRGQLPPGPAGVPILGNLHQLKGDPLPHRTLRELSQKYGDIMFLRFGSIPTVVVSSSQKAKLFLKTHDAVFATRNVTAALRIVFTQNDILMAPYGDHWRILRKMCVNELLSPKKVQSFRHIREREVSAMVEALWEESCHGSRTVDLSAASLDLVSKVSLGSMVGRTYCGDLSLDLKSNFQQGGKALSALNSGDVFPWLDVFDLQGIKKTARAIRKSFDGFFEEIIRKHQENLVDQQSAMDFLDLLLHLAQQDPDTYTMDNIKSILLDLYTGATDSSSVTLEWAMSEIVRNPYIMSRLRQEIESVVAESGGKLDESTVERMKYLQCVIKETLRKHPPIPLGFPRESMESVTVDRFYIPKKTRIMFNAWAIGRDPDVWEDAEEFKPERFMANETVDISGLHDMKMIPFSAGRRACPGIGMASPLLKLCVAALVFAFDWRAENGGDATELDMTESFGLSLRKKHALLLIPHLKNLAPLSST